MTAPLVTVVLPVFQPNPTFLRQAVNSILEQSMPDFELLVIEDPSPVSAAACLDGIRDPRVALHLNSVRTSMVDQLNRGLELSSAQWIARMDGDDIALPDRFERQLERLQQEPRLDVLGTQIEIIDESGKTAGGRTFPLGHDEIYAALKRYNPISHPTVMMRKSTVVDAGLYRHPERAAQDYELWSRLAVGGARFANLNEVTLRYRLHPDSVKSRQTKATLQATTAAKRDHWWPEMSLADRALLAAERMAELLPAGWIRRLARWRRYRA